MPEENEVQETTPTAQARFDQLMESFGDGDAEESDLDEDATDETEGDTQEDEDDATDEDGTAEEGEEGDPEQDDEDPEEDDEDFLSKATLREHQERIKRDPSLRAVHQSMLKDYTQKTQALSKVRKDYETAYSEVQTLTESLNDLGQGGGREEFLLEAALDHPEVFQRAFDRAEKLINDPESKKSYERERAQAEKDRELERRESELRERAVSDQEKSIRKTLNSELDRAKLNTEAGQELASSYVGAAIRKHFREHGDLDLPRSEIVKAVARAVSVLEKERGGVKKEAKTEERTRRLKEAKETLKNAKRPQPPKGGGTPVSVPKPPKREEIPNGQDRIKTRIDQYFGIGG